MLYELIQAVEPLVGVFQAMSNAGQEGLPPVPGNPPVEGTSVVEGEVSQNDLWAALEKKDWEDLISSKEWRSTERHFNLCESKIKTIVEKTLSLYKQGNLPLQIEEDDDIGRGIDAYFADLNHFTSNQQRLQHIQRVHECIGKKKSNMARDKGLHGKLKENSCSSFYLSFELLIYILCMNFISRRKQF